MISLQRGSVTEHVFGAAVWSSERTFGLKVCAEPGCPELSESPFCAAHERKPFATSLRRARLAGKSGWQQQRDARRVLRRYHGVCHVCGLLGASEVDHVVPLAEGGPDVDANKRPIHRRPCHEEKTAAEAARARRR